MVTAGLKGKHETQMLVINAQVKLDHVITA